MQENQLKCEKDKEIEALDATSYRIIDWSRNEHLKQASLEVAATKDEFEYVIPDSLENNTGKKKTLLFIPKKLKTENGEYPLYLKVLFSVLLAVSISLILGKGIIYVISLGQENEITNTPIKEEAIIPSVVDTPQKELHQFPEIVTNIVQAGVFSTKEAATVEKNNLKAKNIESTIVQMDGKYVVYVMIANSLEAAKSLVKNVVGEQAIEVYAKEIVIPQKTFELLDKEFKQVQAIQETFYYQVSMITTLANGIALNPQLQAEWKQIIDSFNEEDIPERFYPLYEILKNGYVLVTDGTTLTKEEIVQQQHQLLLFLDTYQNIAEK